MENEKLKGKARDYKSRKFFLAMLIVVLGSIALYSDQIEDAQYVTLLIGVYSIYSGANVFEHKSTSEAKRDKKPD